MPVFMEEEVKIFTQSKKQFGEFYISNIIECKNDIKNRSRKKKSGVLKIRKPDFFFYRYDNSLK